MNTTTTTDYVKQLKNPAKEKTVEQRQQDFDTWMKDKVKSRFYAQTEKMINAYQKIR